MGIEMPSHLSRACHSEKVRGNIARLIVVPLHPSELRSDPFLVPRVDLVTDCLNEILVFDGSGGRVPFVFLPFFVPLCDTLDRVLAVTANLNWLVITNHLEGTQDGCQFSSLIGLGVALQPL